MNILSGNVLEPKITADIPGIVANDLVSGIINKIYLPQQRANDYLYNQSKTNGCITSEDIDKAAAIYGAHKLTREYLNIYKVNKKASKLIAGKAIDKDSKISDEWYETFIDYISRISDESILNMWAGILAGEILHNGSFRKIMLNRMSLLDRESAEAFTQLCYRTFTIEMSNGENYDMPFYIGNAERSSMGNYSESKLTDDEEFKYLNGLPSEYELQILNEIGFIHLGEDYEFTDFPCEPTEEIIIKISQKSINPFLGEVDGGYYKRIYAGSVIFTPIGIQLYNVLKTTYTPQEYIFPVIYKYNKYFECNYDNLCT